MALSIIKTKRQRQIRKCTILWCFVVLIAVVLLAFGDIAIDKFSQLHKKVQLRLSHVLLTRQKVVFLATFDESIPYDAISLQQIKLFNIPLVKGKYGNGREFNPANNDYSLLQRGDFYSFMQQNGTYSMWLKPFNTKEKQLLINAQNSTGGFSLFIHNDKLSLNYTLHSSQQVLTTSFASTNEFTHIAITFDEKELNLFLNGENKIHLIPDQGVAVAARAFLFSESVFPINGILDDIAILHRTLSHEEIKEIVASKKDIKYKLAPMLSFVERATYLFANFVSSTYRVIDRILPVWRTSTLLKSNIPALSLRMSKKDERHFKNHHEKSLRHGYRTNKAANFRKIHAHIDGSKIEFELALDDVYHLQARSKRQSYLLKDTSKKVINGSGIARIYPPEMHLVLHPDSPKPFPLKPNLIRLYVDDAFEGIYIIEPFDCDGSAWRAYDERPFVAKHALYTNGAPTYENILHPKGTQLDYTQTKKIINSDLLFPWSMQEVKAKEKQNQRTRDQLQIKDFKPALMPIRDILGSNRASLYITTNLNLSHQDYIWKSSNPQILSNLGEVSRPEGHTPKFVKLICEEKSTKKTQEFMLRIMPLKQPIDTLFIYIGNPLSKTKRSDFTCLRLPKDGGKPEWNIGFGSNKSGVKQRGNTSYVKGSRRSLLLKFNTDVNWHNSNTPARHVILYSGYADATRLRNKISFEAFAACNDEKSPHTIPKISFAEVFINNEYFGVYETSQRVKDLCPKNTLLYKVRAKETRLWNIASADMVECVNDYEYSDGDPYDPIRDLFTFTMNSTPDSLTKNGHEKIWLSNLTSFFLILNFTENYDGVFNNQYIARDPKFKKWYIIPWDYDKTFFAKPNALLQNSLLRKLRINPELAYELSKKWTELRSGPLSDEALLKKINYDITILTPYLDNEKNCLYPDLNTLNIEQEISKLKTAVKKNLMRMDNAYLVK